MLGDTIGATLEAPLHRARDPLAVMPPTADHACSTKADRRLLHPLRSDARLAPSPWVERAALLKRLPATRRTWIPFRGGAYSGANLFILRSAGVRSGIALWRSVEQDRKKGWRLLLAMGPSLFLGSALRLLTLDAALQRIGSKLNLTIRAIEMINPLAAVDVDKTDDHRLVEAILAGRA